MDKLHESGQAGAEFDVSRLINADDEVVVTKEMTDAGLRSLLDHRFDEPHYIILEDVFRAMVYASSAQRSKTP